MIAHSQTISPKKYFWQLILLSRASDENVLCAHGCFESPYINVARRGEIGSVEYTPLAMRKLFVMGSMSSLPGIKAQEQGRHRKRWRIKLGHA